MKTKELIISKGCLQEKQLLGNIALITGAGGGIGYETARSLIWLGVKVIIAEIDKDKGKNAEIELNREFGDGNALFIHTDIGDEKSVKRLVKKVYKNFNKLDIIINNATIAAIGAINEVGIEKWDLSYRTNLRGPVLLLTHFLPEMRKRDSGIIVFIPSSGAAPFMGAYEVFKTSQVELANTLNAELEKTNIITYSIGPGLVKTETANKTIEKLAPLYKKSVEEFYEMSKKMILSVEEAGAGFAGSIALAPKYEGLEIGSIQVLMDMGISISEKESTYIKLSEEEKKYILELLKDISKTFNEQVEGWLNKSIFEKQWIIRDFKKHTGSNTEYFINRLKEIENLINIDRITKNNNIKMDIEKLSSYYKHQIDLMKGYEKDPDKVIEYTNVLLEWIEKIDKFKDSIEEYC